MSVPSTEINICSNVGLDNRYIHTIHFATPADQLDYFSGKVVKHLAAYSYGRRSWRLRVEHDATKSLPNWNYLFFRRSGEDRWLFYFINAIEYVNDNTVELDLEMDVMQTYHFIYDLTPCFVEREHVTDDTIGRHTVDEGLELGEYITNDRGDIDELNEMCLVILSTENLAYIYKTETTEGKPVTIGSYLDRVISGLCVFVCSLANPSVTLSAIETVTGTAGADAIVNMFMYPKALVELDEGLTWDSDIVFLRPSGCSTITNSFITDDTLNGYKPINNKLLTYPFTMFYVTNNTGNAATFKPELSNVTGSHDEPAFTFKIVGALGADTGVKLYPVNYNGLQDNFDEGLTLTNFPTVAWSNDTFKIWLAQTQNSQNLSMTLSGLSVAAGAVSTVAGAATGNLVAAGAGVGAMVNGATSIAQTLAERKDRSLQPAQARGSYSASLNVSHKKQTFTIMTKSINAEHARIIDEYLTMYGYKINRVKKPSRKNRKAFTHVRTIGCHVTGVICNEDKVKIESIFDGGITFWVDGDKIGDYAQDNSILTT